MIRKFLMIIFSLTLIIFVSQALAKHKENMDHLKRDLEKFNNSDCGKKCKIGGKMAQQDADKCYDVLTNKCKKEIRRIYNTN